MRAEVAASWRESAVRCRRAPCGRPSAPLLLGLSLVCSFAAALPRAQDARREYRGRPIPLHGGGSASAEVWQRVQEKDGLFAPVGPARRSKFLFRTASFAQTISNTSSTFFVKAPGSVLNPSNWPTMLRSIAAGAPERTVRMVPMNRDVDQEGPLVMIDGADDIATALQGSGLPQNLASALQAFVLYPLVLPVVELGFRGAQDDHDENMAEAFEAAQDVAELKAGLIEQLALFRSAVAADSEGSETMTAFEIFAAQTPPPQQDPDDAGSDGQRAPPSWWAQLQGWALQYPRVQAAALEPTERRTTLQGRIYSFLLQDCCKGGYTRPCCSRHSRAEARGYHFEEHLRDLAFIEKARAVLVCICSRGLLNNSALAFGEGCGREEGSQKGGSACCDAAVFAQHHQVEEGGRVQERRPALEQLEHAIRLLAALDGVVSKAWEPRVRASFTSPVAMLATASMWWAMLCYQLVALAEFFGPDDAFVTRWLVPSSRSLATYLLPFGQACMAVYGLSVGINGLRESAELEEELMLVRKSAALACFPEVQLVLRRQLGRLWTCNLAAEVVAGPLLFAGQALMAAGAPGMLSNIYVLAFGGLLSAISIITKTVVELDTESRFGYDDDALPVHHTLVSHLPGHVSKGCSHSFDVRSLAVIQRRREVRLRKLAWLKVLSAVVPILASSRLEGRKAGPAWSVERREALASTLYQKGYDFELCKCLKEIFRNADAWRALVRSAEVYGGSAPEEHVGERGGGREAALGRWRPFAAHVAARPGRRRQPLYLSFLYLRGVENAFGTAKAAVFHDDDECIAAEESDELWITSTAAALAEASASWATMTHLQRIEEVLASLHHHKHTDSVHHAVLEEILIHQRLRPREHASVFSRSIDFSASSPAPTSVAPPIIGLPQSWAGARATEGCSEDSAAAGRRLLGSLVERTACLQKRRIKVPGGTLWRYLKGKHTYRFQLQRFLALLHSHPLLRPVAPSPPPPPPAAGMTAEEVARSETAARDMEVWRERDRVWREKGVALEWAANAVEEACWQVVKLEAKKRLRSEVACLNEALLELLREHEMRTAILSTPAGPFNSTAA